jgi:CRISPR-associated protein Csb1
VWCVLLDSVQSQANRLEEALLATAEAGRIDLPRLVVDFAQSGLNSIGRISSLDAPHRIFDAILRDSLLAGAPFQSSPLGLALKQATTKDATAILEASPSALLFGAWNSTGEGGGVGAKFTRAMVSEIIGVGVSVDSQEGRGERPRTLSRTGSRIDPLGVIRSVPVFKGEAGWDTTEKAAGKGAKKVRPSEINHGNIVPSVVPLGVSCDYAEQTTVITMAGLRRLRFGTDAARTSAGRALIAALGLVALIEQDAQGYALRSRCDLVCEGAAPLELVHADGTTQDISLTRDEATALYAAALKGARAAGFAFARAPIQLTPQDKLVHIVRMSMERALAGQGEAGDDDADG